ncbi:MAG: hypothetical protein IJT13_00940 [Bacteroidaceae bacterium]|nr:hypothetical protein [Bacteroidaceae bacterium]
MLEKRSFAALACALLLLNNIGVSAQSEEVPVSEQYSGANAFDRFRFGGYGEMTANFKDYGTNRFWGGVTGNAKESRSTVSIPRFVLAFDYKFSSKWILGAEIEFESGGTGSAVEIENSENGEFETEIEKGGEVCLEQFHITRLIVPEFNVRMGHLIVPIGLTNAHHEPINFFTTSRPEGEMTILPCTWHQTGLEFFGNVGRGLWRFNYEALVVAGMNPDGFSRDNWIRKGSKALFEEENFTRPALAARIEWKGIDGLRLGVSAYYNDNVIKNSSKPHKYVNVGKSSLSILSADAQYAGKFVTARANVVYGRLSNSNLLSTVTNLGSGSPYPGARFRNVAHTALAYGAELGLNLRNIVNAPYFPAIISFVRYEYYNPQEKGLGKQVMDSRCQVSKWTFGLNWRALPNLVVKADYTTRQIGTHSVLGKSGMNSENEFGLGLAYIGWFIKK